MLAKLWPQVLQHQHQYQNQHNNLVHLQSCEQFRLVQFHARQTNNKTWVRQKMAHTETRNLFKVSDSEPSYLKIDTELTMGMSEEYR